MQLRDVLFAVLIVGITVVVVLLALVLYRVFEILRDVKSVTTSARRTGKVAEILARRVIAPISTVVGAGAGAKKAVKVLANRKKRRP